MKEYLFIAIISFLLLPIQSFSQENSNRMADFDEDSFVMNAEKGDFDAVKQFLKEGMNIDDRNQLLHTALMRAAYGGHIEIVSFLINKGADINISTTEDHTALYFAVIENRLEVAKLLIEKGADVNTEVDNPIWLYSSLVFTAMVYEHEEMADLLIASGAYTYGKSRYLYIQLYQALSEGNEEAVKDLISQKSVNVNATTSVLLRYENGSAKTRALIRKYGPEEIKNGKSNLLDDLLDNNVIIDDRYNDPELKFPLATTFLPNEKQPFRYAPDKAFDGELSTSWVEGVEGLSAGQKIAFEVNKAKGITILPGFGKDTYFKKNNRVRKAKLSIYKLRGEATMTRVGLYFSEKLFEKILEFEDKMSMQEFHFPKPLSGIAVLEILEVYPGETWDDTCISEIKILQ